MAANAQQKADIAEAKKSVKTDESLPKNNDDNVARAASVQQGDIKVIQASNKKKADLKKEQEVKAKKMKEEQAKYAKFVSTSNLSSILLENGSKLMVSIYTKLSPLMLHKETQAELIKTVISTKLFKAIK